MLFQIANDAQYVTYNLINVDIVVMGVYNVDYILSECGVVPCACFHKWNYILLTRITIHSCISSSTNTIVIIITGTMVTTV